MQYRAKQTVIVVICGMLLGHPAAASDAEFARALNETRCMPARIVVLRDDKDDKSYEVTCLGSPLTKYWGVLYETCLFCVSCYWGHGF